MRRNISLVLMAAVIVINMVFNEETGELEVKKELWISVIDFRQ